MGCTQSSTAATATKSATTEKKSCECCASKTDNCAVKKEQPAPPPNVPRTAWMIFAVDGKKVGKIVMQLKGKGVSEAADEFEFIYKNGKVSPSDWSIDVKPKFYIASKGGKELDKKNDIYGVIIEGQDVYTELQKAEASSEITVKQAHLFPVKVAK